MTAKEVELTGGAPWGFRMHGGADQNQPLRISRRYSDTHERNLDVNPGRKASLSGIREGDVISSINGRPTKGMSNSDAHAMLRTAGPMLKLGLNEDRDVSPRRRSIGKGSELKRPSQLIAEVQSDRATPQPPVYATIRPSQSPQYKPSQSPIRASLNSLPAALNSTSLVQSVVQKEEPVRFHPTNPFFTTLPSNYSSASKLPVPNGRTSLSSLDRNKIKTSSSYIDSSSDLKSSSPFSRTSNSGPHSLPFSYHNETQNTNGNVNYTTPSINKEKTDQVFYSHPADQFHDKNLPGHGQNNTKNPFETKRNSDPFEKYLRPNNDFNEKPDSESKTMSNSVSDNNFHLNENITKRSTFIEEKISEVEEVKTIKKIVLNGCDNKDNQNGHSLKFDSPSANGEGKNSDGQPFPRSDSLLCHQSPRCESVLSTPIHDRNEYLNTFNQDERDCTSTRMYASAHKGNGSGSIVKSTPRYIFMRTNIFAYKVSFEVELKLTSKVFIRA
ncbi:unnamed protein product [Arctia plantaginis]|uniref:PDZ domain-containing protein n=1 Tax=Arctia plantaginis TaxID=874455 RepID=A0A8S0ZU53_ARCPL|nr:unnamed protein product [Arctia plantaginis]